MYQAFAGAFDSASQDMTLRCIVLGASGTRAFCVGSDIGEFNASLGQPDRQIAKTRTGRRAMDTMAACPHPIVGAIKGICVGGGLELASLCDLRIVDNTVKLGIPVKSLNMHVEIEDLKEMQRAFGSGLSLDLLLTGRLMGAVEAQERGLVHRIVESARVDATAAELASDIASGAPLAARWHKKALRNLSQPVADISQLAEQALDCYRQDDFSEGCAAFAEKRAPVFKGH